MAKIIERREVTDVNWQTTDIPPLLQRIYTARGVQTPDDLKLDLNQLFSYELLTGIQNAVQCLSQALKERQHIMVIGDFDADGATSTVLAVDALRQFGAEKVSYLVPNRFEYGYGLTPEIVAVAAEKRPELIVTVDNGISSCAGVKAANDLGIKVLITDHHVPSEELPYAAAIVNPNLPLDQFPSKALAGVGVIFYVMLALRAHLRDQCWFDEQEIDEPNMAQFLDLVALGTIADVVPLDRNNRILVKQGLNRVRAGRCRPGIKALLAATGRVCENTVVSDLGFSIGPRLNAAGRLDDMSLGIECLLASSVNDAKEIASHLDGLNKERRHIETDMQRQAYESLDQIKLESDLPKGICLYDEGWHQGVIGILASRLKDRLHRPIVAFADGGDGILKGSGRSVQGVHIRDLFDTIASRHPGLITKFGGHAMAAGLSLSADRLDDFKTAFSEEVGHHLTEDDLCGKIHTDGELAPEEVTLGTALLVREAGPWGQGFPEPLFDGVFRLINQKIVGQRHLKLLLSVPNSSKLVDAIAFNIDLENWPNHRCEQIRAVFRLEVNRFRGIEQLQLVMEYMEPV